MITKAPSSIIKTDYGISLHGDFVYSNVSDLLNQGSQSIQEHLKSKKNEEITIDCQAMSRIDSAGIALLIEWQRQCLVAKSNCVFVDLSEQAQSLIHAYRLQSIIAA